MNLQTMQYVTATNSKRKRPLLLLSPAPAPVSPGLWRCELFWWWFLSRACKNLKTRKQIWWSRSPVYSCPHVSATPTTTTHKQTNTRMNISARYVVYRCQTVHFDISLYPGPDDGDGRCLLAGCCFIFVSPAGFFKLSDLLKLSLQSHCEHPR